MNKAILFTIVLYIGTLHAYEPPTHQAISKEAYERSILKLDDDIFVSLGLNADYKVNIFPNAEGNDRNILQLVLDGAEFEDAIVAIGFDVEVLRSKHHFYDPQNNRAFSGRGLYFLPIVPGIFGIGEPSADWALEDIGVISGQNFSYSDSNEFFYRALTSPTEIVRKQNWGLTFQSLGQVIHHIQDMAQPQHTRNDAHPPIPSSTQQYYESYTEEKRVDLNRGLTYTGYPDIDFNAFSTPRLFWDNEDVNNGKGLAEFTSTNFVSIGTNFKGGVVSGNNLINSQTHPDYNFPSSDNLEIIHKLITDPDLLGPPGPEQLLTGDIQFIGTQVTDAYIQSESKVNPRTSSFSIFDNDLEGNGFDKIFNLNRFNYDAAHEFLIPRAVAYSAGLIDYFFRGRISTAITADGDGIEITNTSNGGVTDPDSPTTFQAGGAFEVYYVTNTGEHKPLLSLTNLALGSSLPINGIHTITGLTAALQGITDMGNDGEIIVLFDGDIGFERGLAVAYSKSEIFCSGLNQELSFTFDGSSIGGGTGDSRLTSWEEQALRDFSLKPDGTKIFLSVYGDGSIEPSRIISMDLTTPYELSTATNKITKDISSQLFIDGNLRNNYGFMEMSSNGEYIYIHSLEAQSYYISLKLLTPWDITTIVYDHHIIDEITGSHGDMNNFIISDDGTTGLYNNFYGFFSFHLSTAWDLRTLTELYRGPPFIELLSNHFIRSYNHQCDGEVLVNVTATEVTLYGLKTAWYPNAIDITINISHDIVPGVFSFGFGRSFVAGNRVYILGTDNRTLLNFRIESFTLR